MIKIGITGNIASGKSEAEKIISEYNYPIIDTDKITHYLLDNSDEVKNNILKTFQNYDICDDNGVISRKKLGQIVFSNPDLLKSLENIIHPLVMNETERFFEENKAQKASFVSVPLLYEVNLSYLFDKVILIYTDDKIREKRLIENRHYSKEEAIKRMATQMPQDKKLKLADYVVYNNSDLLNLSAQIRKILGDLNINY